MKSLSHKFMPICGYGFIMVAFLWSAAALAQPPMPTGPALCMSEAGRAGRDRPEPPLPGALIEPQLAFVKTALKLTDPQLPAWNAVSDALREQAKRRDAEITEQRAEAEKPAGGDDLIAHMQDRRRHAVEESDDLAKLLAALKPLYASFSADQKETAAHLFPLGAQEGGPFPQPSCQPFFRHEWH